MQQDNNYNAFAFYAKVAFACLIMLYAVFVWSSFESSASEPETAQTVSGQELPVESLEQNQEKVKDDQISSIDNSEIHNTEAYTVSGPDDNISLEENEMMKDLLVRLDRLIELLTLDEPEPAALNAKDIMYPHGYQDWPYPVLVHYSILTSEGYGTEYAEKCYSMDDFFKSFQYLLDNIADGTIKNFFVRYVLKVDDNAAGGLVYDYAHPVYQTAEDSDEEEAEDEFMSGDFLSHLESIDEKLSDMQEENQHLTVSGNELISSLDDTIQKGNEENRQTITDLFTQGTTYILAFIGIVVGCITGVILSRYLKHD